MGLLDKFLLDSPPPKTESAPTASIVEVLGGGSRNIDAFAISGKEVGKSRDLARILELPRRAKPDANALEAIRLSFAHLERANDACNCKSKFGKRCAKRLLDTQAWALTEIRNHEGLLGPISVGDGKTLLDLLAAMAMPDCKAAVLLIPPQLRDQLLTVDWEFYSQHWLLPNLASGKWFVPGRPMLHVIAYSELSNAKNSDVLDRINPDLIIADEAHLLRNAGAARTKRFKRYLSAHPQCRFCCWSGTLTTKSIKDYAHLAEFALHDGSPAPTHWPTVEEWAGAIDPCDYPTGIGELKALCEPGEHVRDGYRRRLEATGGVVSSPATMSCTASLVIAERKVEAPKQIHDALQELYLKWARPDGEELVSALDVHRCAKELSSGFYYRWTWPKKEPLEARNLWLQVRKDWHKEMREKLKQSKEFMDSPLLLTKAAIRWHDGYTHIKRDADGRELGREVIPPHTQHGPQPTWASDMWPDWQTVRDTCEPATEAVWLSDFLVVDAATWLTEGAGICWYEHSCFGAAVKDVFGPGVELFGPGEQGKGIIHEKGDRAIIASIKAHGTGKNLQMFNRTLYANVPSGADVWEQSLGRTHRQGQEADEVRADVYRHTPALIEAFDRAKTHAQYIQDTMGGSQKLLRATCIFTR